MSIPTLPQAKNAELPYVLDWSKWLEVGEVLATATFEVEAGLVNDGDTHDDTTATINIKTTRRRSRRTFGSSTSRSKSFRGDARRFQRLINNG